MGSLFTSHTSNFFPATQDDQGIERIGELFQQILLDIYHSDHVTKTQLTYTAIPKFMPVPVAEIKSPDDELIDEEDYDEEADDDFDDRTEEGSVSSSAEDDNETVRKREKNNKTTSNSTQVTGDLDSGDEATIKERQKVRKRQKRNTDAQLSSDEENAEGWRAKTRSMRTNETVQRQAKARANIQKSTIDVNKIWEEMNKPGTLPPVHVEEQTDPTISPGKQASGHQSGRQPGNSSGSLVEDTVTIRRQFKFAGEIHVEEKVVPKSSAEAKLWLAQQEHNEKPPKPENDRVQRPLRKISRFDPNYSNIDAFRNASIKAQPSALTGPKLNVVEKSKIDWASHVDAEGLKDELEVHAKAKDAYLNRMDFLQDVERRKEDEAKLARQKV